MLSLVIAESALELVPPELQKHNSVLASARRSKKKPSEILLDISWHFAAMKGIKDEIKRGRPDLVHFSLLEACSIPLYFEKKLCVFVHTIDDKVIFVSQNVRLPKSYHRFVGLIEKLYSTGKIEEDNKTLLEIKNMDFSSLMDKIKPKQIVGLSTKGTLISYQQLALELDSETCLVVGGFAKGHFSDMTKKHFDRTVSINKNALEAHVIISRVLYEYEKRIIM
ncbi:MAG: ribosome biogenesis protein [Thaumarchaeota archaeon]|nr:MAG: ribosome biogenesis protein [Nitrososphaerota archaeon]TLX94684.1 MAG: ribosome biogenesis protein [Nitrososphaerota archaeon]